MPIRLRVIASTLLLLAYGCGGSSGPTLYNVKGTVTFDGQPVPFGRVEFEPDTTKGTTGGSGYADIVDGKYDTAVTGGRGVIGGPHIVRLQGMDAKPPMSAGTIDETAEAANAPKLLFSGYSEPHDLPMSDTTLDLNIPASAKFDPAAASSESRNKGP